MRISSHLFARRGHAVLLVALAFFAACRDQPLRNVSGAIVLSPSALDFGAVYLGHPVEKPLRVRNESRTTRTVEWRSPIDAFVLISPPSQIPTGELALTVRFAPTEAGIVTSQLQVTIDDGSELAIPVQGTGQPVPDCPAPNSCQQSAFDFAEGRCIDSTLPDGLSCDPHSVCLMNTACRTGQCVGTGRVCDDHNACTIDTCDPVAGCQFLAAPPCPVDGVCQVGICDPLSGCGLAPAADGTRCGPLYTCELADVCINSACVQRHPPEGSICAEASPCQAEGHCHNDVCQQPSASSLSSLYNFDTLSENPPKELHDFVLESGGAISLSGFFSELRTRDNTPSRRTLSSARRCILWNGRYVCADFPNSGGYGRVSTVDLVTGSLVWSFNLPQARPDFAALAAPGQLFMARLAAMGVNRLAALYEAYPLGSDPGSNCRLYFLVILSGNGQLVAAQRLTDPFLDVCSHPHPYGVAADLDGNLYIGFSYSLANVAPLVPQPPMLLMAFRGDATVRWKTLEPALTAGELAMVRGRIFAERNTYAYAAETGVKSADVGLLGRIVATSQTFIPSPFEGGSQVTARRLATLQPAWIYSLPTGDVFISDQIRLGVWQSLISHSAEATALMFSRHGGQPSLVAINAERGWETWRCPVNVPARANPQLFELANGFIGVMEGAQSCGRCDPPFATSKAAFHLLSTPGLEVSQEPWTGAFGGPTHDHREKPGVPPPN